MVSVVFLSEKKPMWSFTENNTNITDKKVGLAKTQQNLSKASSSTFMSSEKNKLNIIETLNVLVLLVLAIIKCPI